MIAGLLKFAAASLAAKQVERSIRNVVTQAILLSFAAIAAAIGFGFLVWAVWMALAAAFTPLTATVAIGAGMMAVALLIYAIAVSLRHQHRTRHNSQSAMSALSTDGQVNDERINALATLGLVAGIGYVIARTMVRR